MQIQQTFNNLSSYSNFNKTSLNQESTKDSKQQNSTIDETKANGEPLSNSEKQYISKLESIDRNVKAHEAAHIAAGGGVVSGGASYGYTRGPDGKLYATSGEVPISMKKGDTPEETIQNAMSIQAAAMAPSDPSPQDYKVAASAAQMESSARVEQAEEKAKEAEENLKKIDENKDSNQASNNAESKQAESTNKKGFFDDEFKKDSKESKNIDSKSDLYSYALQSYSKNANQDSYNLHFEIAG